MKKLYFTADKTEKAQDAFAYLTKTFGQYSASKADVIVPLGGDGFLLKTMHKYITKGIPFYGLNLGNVGFLLNNYNPDRFLEDLENSQSAILHPLKMTAISANKEMEALALNDVSLFRHSSQAADISISINGIERLADLICDGVLISTPAGSTAYNFSVRGPVLPLNSNVLALTPVSPFRPRRWQGSILTQDTEVLFKIHQPYKRPVNAVADYMELKQVSEVKVLMDKSVEIHLLFDVKYNLQDRIMDEQFI
ncbi:MAG: NAD kinase [Alphaproteobacteria bacterium]|nr:NAD kinase [Alphaproteobacteria bacterium]